MGLVWLVAFAGFGIVGDVRGWVSNPEPFAIIAFAGMAVALIATLRRQHRRLRLTGTQLREVAKLPIGPERGDIPVELHLGFVHWRLVTTVVFALNLLVIGVLPMISSVGAWLFPVLFAVFGLIMFLRNGPGAYDAVSATVDQTGVTLRHRGFHAPWSIVRSVKATPYGVDIEIRGVVTEIEGLPRRWRRRAVERAHRGVRKRLWNQRPEVAVRMARHYGGL
ncbi:hypothetical protein AB0M47_06530 [Hamadaea sp. NPDC051192]|uniref:hypothetical protein n=1 Tax=Hamadaea sp. NPDC051192 TaxID=3154940 RepID=UPI00343DF3DC